MNMPWAAYFGEDRVAYSVSMEDFTTVVCKMNEGIADSLGFSMTHEISGDSITFTVTAS
jgi:hypothetical protein